MDHFYPPSTDGSGPVTKADITHMLNEMQLIREEIEKLRHNLSQSVYYARLS
ncbi:hypothetical protein BABINDRAFT_161351 [Babjeviella inositovora NRRL Y-12698]|uniref:Uncharacterized protein n=1 Tax=Babjeviella inositovora NRRL Y-12698 TaxID=984486 RepID=A0A1E3QRR4_9ASCO|nr:uncharacterized protein BABINDRAFT_161351 [Babjeviella inositovora NRRL Y-12698]ODQ80406.1 hypothetical protein BABINDRAFT_161351 [Babjeviella inositovora NRRL Y-12698]